MEDEAVDVEDWDNSSPSDDIVIGLEICFGVL